MTIPRDKKPTGEFIQAVLQQNVEQPQLVDLSSLTIKPSGALITCYSVNNTGQQLDKDWILLGFGNDQSCQTYVLKFGESIFIDNYNSLENLWFWVGGSSDGSASIKITFFNQI